MGAQRVDVNETVTVWLAQLRQGDHRAVDLLWRRYFDRVVALARARLGGLPRKAADEEDVALSVFDTLCRGVIAGKYPQLEDSHGLWPLLVVLTVRKACDRLNHERRQKRGGGLVRAEADVGADDDDAFRLDSILNDEPTPVMLAIMDEQCERLFARLDDDQRKIARGKLQGYTNQELADQLDCGLRTIERRLDLIRRIWEHAIDGDTGEHV
jgi:DNA-directed RNA polymerase specialized sigma24 family protein